MTTEAPREVEFPCIEVEQPLGTFYLTKIAHTVLRDISYFDVRRILGEREFETYLGIQRRLQENRVKEIKRYVETADACFPTNIILSVDSRSAQVRNGALLLRNDPNPENGLEPIYYRNIAKVLDGQHRIAGLYELADDSVFEVPVCVFVDLDLSDEAYIFSTVNLAQTKVQKSLVYDLFELANSRSPQKTAHSIAVALDRTEKSPFHLRIKRLGSATPGGFSETITQATFVEGLLSHISANAVQDRDLYLRGKKPGLPTQEEAAKHVLRLFFVREQDEKIADVLWNYFDAVRERWPEAWSSSAAGQMLNRTNGVRALMRFLGPAYRHVGGIGAVPTMEQFKAIFEKVPLASDDFNVERYKPGTSGESLLYNELISTGLGGKLF